MRNGNDPSDLRVWISHHTKRFRSRIWLSPPLTTLPTQPDIPPALPPVLPVKPRLAGADRPFADLALGLNGGTPASGWYPPNGYSCPRVNCRFLDRHTLSPSPATIVTQVATSKWKKTPHAQT